jgi:hypothetical protein
MRRRLKPEGSAPGPSRSGDRRWLAEHPGYLLHRVQCSGANDLSRLREQVETPQAWPAANGTTAWGGG